MRSIRVASSLAALCAVMLVAESRGEDKLITFKKQVLDTKFRSEGVSVGDFNHDGKMDISAGSVYYAAPDWKMVPVLDQPLEYDPMVYSNSFCNFADDVNGDGWTDLLVVDFPGAQTWYLQNPKESGGAWPRSACTLVTNNESPNYQDVDGDGKRELVLATVPATLADPKNFDAAERQMALLRPGKNPADPWLVQTISDASAPGTMRFSHGLGIGDVNADGKQDLLVTEGWWESPKDAKAAGAWTFHKAPFGEACAQMYVHDFDGDGDQDVVSSSAHKIGIWWHEKTADGWATHVIDDSFSQTHSMCFADINGDGMMDFVTGKRWWAHGPKGDPSSDQPAVLVWFELHRKDGKPVWNPHLIDHDSGVGTQFEVADVNGDKLLDVVIANKKGAFYFEQSR